MAGHVVWFTGLSGAGKSTIARIVESKIEERGQFAFFIDGDALRAGLCSDLGFSRCDRQENLRRATEVAALLAERDLIVLAAFITPLQVDRERIRQRLKVHNYLEVFVDCPLAVAESRDPKGLYARARRGEIRAFTGIDSPYETPTGPDARLDTSRHDASTLAEAVVSLLLARKALASTARRYPVN